jgi:uncharacterized protein (TIGR03435 family)
MGKNPVLRLSADIEPLTYDDHRTNVAARMSDDNNHTGTTSMAFALRRTGRRFASCLATSIAAVALAQAPAGPPVVHVFHPSGAPVAYDVATIKPSDPDQPYAGTTLRRYIANAFGVPIPWGIQGVEFAGAQVLGGPAWIDNDRYDIKAKPSDELREALQKMSREERTAKNETMQQTLLSERFHLKVHFETREMQVYELVAAKGGLKIKPVDSATDADAKPLKPGEMSPNSMSAQVNQYGATVIAARAASLDMLCNGLRGQSPDIAGRPIIDRTGFQGKIDIKDFRFQGQAPPAAHGSSTGDEDPPPSVFEALEQQLGLKLIPAKGQVEVVVIDSIDRPTEN